MINQVNLLKNHSDCNIKNRMEVRMDVERWYKEVISLDQERGNVGQD